MKEKLFALGFNHHINNAYIYGNSSVCGMIVIITLLNKLEASIWYYDYYLMDENQIKINRDYTPEKLIEVYESFHKWYKENVEE